MGRHETTLDRVRDYATIGFYLGVALSAYALLLLLVRGTTPYDALGLSPFVLAGLYLFGGVTAGAIVGLLTPITGTLLGRLVVGIVAAWPFSVVGLLSFLSPERIPTALVPLSLMLAGFWGTVGGLISWWQRGR